MVVRDYQDVEGSLWERLLHQRCIVHKLRNIVNHLPSIVAVRQKRRFNRALEMTRLDEAEKELKSMERWLKSINQSAAASLQKGMLNC